MIYLTPFDPATKQCTGPSVPSGFESLAQVVEMMGPPLHPGVRIHCYPGGVAFSDFILRIEP